MRTQAEILARVKELVGNKQSDLWGVEIMDLVEHLDYAEAKEFLTPETPEAEWQDLRASVKPVITQMIEYLPFARDKSHNERGLSVLRAMYHYRAWLWLLGSPLYENILEYNDYAKENLNKIEQFIMTQAVAA